MIVNDGSPMAERSEFQGLQQVDYDLSRSTQPSFAGDGLGLLRTAMNGTSYTRNKQIHTGKIPSKMCPHCGEEDVVPHRIFHCAGFNDLRTLVSEPTWHFLRTQPPCTHLHGWMTEGTAARG